SNSIERASLLVLVQVHDRKDSCFRCRCNLRQRAEHLSNFRIIERIKFADIRVQRDDDDEYGVGLGDEMAVVVHVPVKEESVRLSILEVDALVVSAHLCHAWTDCIGCVIYQPCHEYIPNWSCSNNRPCISARDV